MDTRSVPISLTRSCEFPTLFGGGAAGDVTLFAPYGIAPALLHGWDKPQPAWYHAIAATVRRYAEVVKD